ILSLSSFCVATVTVPARAGQATVRIPRKLAIRADISVMAANQSVGFYRRKVTLYRSAELCFVEPSARNPIVLVLVLVLDPAVFPRTRTRTRTRTSDCREAGPPNPALRLLLSC